MPPYQSTSVAIDVWLPLRFCVATEYMSDHEEEVFEATPSETKKSKSKGPMSAERRAQLLANLAKGRETSARKRKERAEAKRIKQSIKDAEVQHFLNLKKESTQSTSTKFDPTSMLAKIAALESKLAAWEVDQSPSEVATPPPPKPAPAPKTTAAPPVQEQLEMYTTFDSLPW